MSKGIPLEGDRAAFAVTEHKETHADDLVGGAPRLAHLPNPGSVGNVVVDDGEKWVSQALAELPAALGNGTAQYQIPLTGVDPYTGAWTDLDSIFGNGLVVTAGLCAVKLLPDNPGLTLDGDGLRLGTPSTLTVSTENGVSGTGHAHTITSSSNPGAAASLLASDASGYLQLSSMGLGMTPGTSAKLLIGGAGNSLDAIKAGSATQTFYTGFYFYTDTTTGAFFQGGSTYVNYAGASSLNLYSSHAIGLVPDGTLLVYMGGSKFGIGTVLPTARLQVVGNASIVQVIVQGDVAQGTDLTQWQTSTGTVLQAIDKQGFIYQGNFATQTDLSVYYVGHAFTSASSVYGINISVQQKGSGNLYGSSVFASQRLDQLIGTLVAYNASIGSHNLSTGNITNASGFYYSGFTKGGSGTINTIRALWIADVTEATTNYAIYTSKGTNRFGDQLTITGWQDVIQLTVKANATQTTNLQEWQNSGAGILAAISGDGRVSIGTTPQAYVKLYNAATWIDPTTTSEGIHNTTVFTLTDNNAYQARGIANYLYADIATGKTASGSMYALHGALYIKSTNLGAATNVYGLYFYSGAEAGAAGTITSMAVYNASHYSTGANTVAYTNWYGFSVSILDASALNGATITNAYGLYINNITGGGTLNYAIYTNTGKIKFGDAVAIGGTPNANYELYVTKTFDATVSQYGIFNQTFSQPGSDSAQTTMAAYFAAYKSGAYNLSQLIGLRAFAYHNGSAGVLSTARSIYASYGFTGATGGSITTAEAIYVDVPNWGYTGSVAVGTGYGIHITNQGHAEVTTSYGLKIESQSGSGSNYGIFAGAGLHYFGDQLAIVGSADRIQLSVKANATQTTNLISFLSSASATIGGINSLGYAGFGAGPSVDYGINASVTVSDPTNDKRGFSSNLTVTLTSPNSKYLVAANGYTYLAAATTANHTGALIGGWYQVNVQSTSAIVVSNVWGFQAAGYLTAASPATITKMMGAYIGLGNQSTVGGIIATMHNIEVGSPIATGQITTLRGLVIGDMTAGSTNNNAVYTGLGLNRLGDQLTIYGQRDRIQLVVKASLTYKDAIVFTGVGLNDLAHSSSTTTSVVNDSIITIIIDSTGTPDTFKWRKGTAPWITGVAITGSSQGLGDAGTVIFTATTGHTLNDQWTYNTHYQNYDLQQWQVGPTSVGIVISAMDRNGSLRLGMASPRTDRTYRLDVQGDARAGSVESSFKGKYSGDGAQLDNVSRTTISSFAPVNPRPGDIWIDIS